MTLAQIRRRVNALTRKFAPELAIIKLRRIAETVADHWTPPNHLPPPMSSDASPTPAAAFPTFARLHHYLDDTRRQGEVPMPGSSSHPPPLGRPRPLPRVLHWDLPALTQRAAVL